MPITLILRNPLDRDAREYISRAGISDLTARLRINEFVRGAKSLGLWSTMVCWPMRSSQNAGTGTKVQSLGGLGTVESTLVGGPTWGVDGITFSTALSQRGAIPEVKLRAGFGYCYFTDVTQLNQRVLELNAGTSTTCYFALRYDCNNSFTALGAKVVATYNSTAAFASSGSASPMNAWVYVGGAAEVSRLYAYQNTGVKVENTAVTNYNPSGSMEDPGLSPVIGRIDGKSAIIGGFSNAISPESHAALRTLLLSTLCQGL